MTGAPPAVPGGDGTTGTAGAVSVESAGGEGSTTTDEAVGDVAGSVIAAGEVKASGEVTVAAGGLAENESVMTAGVADVEGVESVSSFAGASVPLSLPLPVLSAAAW